MNCGEGSKGKKGKAKNADFYDMQKYSKTMQMKQFSLAGIPLRTIIKSSQSGIAISNHKRDPRQAEPGLGLGPGRCEECRAGSEPAVPMLWGAQSPQEHQQSVLGGPWQGTGRWDPWRKEFEFTELLRASTQALGWDRGLQVTPPIMSTAQGASTLNWGALVTWGSVAQAEERGHTGGSEGAHEIRNYNYNNGNSVSS